MGSFDWIEKALELVGRRPPSRADDEEATFAPRRRWIWPILLGGSIVALGFAWRLHEGRRAESEWPARRALPPDATDVREWSWEAGFPDWDYEYQLKARVTQEQFERWARALDLAPHSPDQAISSELSTLKWPRRAETPWFDPSPDIERIFVWQSGPTWSYAKYEDGYLYFVSFARDPRYHTDPSPDPPRPRSP